MKALDVGALAAHAKPIAASESAGRLARYLLSVADPRDGSVQLPSLKKHLASHLNLTSETLSRTLRRLMEMGAIEAAGDQELRVVDRDTLTLLADGMSSLRSNSAPAESPNR